MEITANCNHSGLRRSGSGALQNSGRRRATAATSGAQSSTTGAADGRSMVGTQRSEEVEFWSPGRKRIEDIRLCKQRGEWRTENLSDQVLDKAQAVEDRGGGRRGGRRRKGSGNGSRGGRRSGR